MPSVSARGFIFERRMWMDFAEFDEETMLQRYSLWVQVSLLLWSRNVTTRKYSPSHIQPPYAMHQHVLPCVYRPDTSMHQWRPVGMLVAST